MNRAGKADGARWVGIPSLQQAQHACTAIIIMIHYRLKKKRENIRQLWAPTREGGGGGAGGKGVGETPGPPGRDPHCGSQQGNKKAVVKKAGGVLNFCVRGIPTAAHSKRTKAVL